ncbi:5-oxoprolinase subunit B family protein [Alteromonas sp. ASW11-130]|uniref:5-oxoprolinase subunit B family protein n=1 Tax=Alteromonas sp. ASW11-130 TaxID=3015775 RepID=UPI0022428D25|nr:allophanate hydrolase subunit 1 [Alteromonas sp. ASW11-130]MCW8092041.1 allophanate hydrolase subunit 1 [Alteromonas sp. ASW11-130]
MKAFKHIKHIAYAGMDGLILYFAGEIGPANQRIQQYMQAISYDKPDWLKSLIPSYDTLLVCFDCFKVDSHFVYQYLANLEIESSFTSDSSHHHIPVWYDCPQTSDFEQIKNQTGLEKNEVIELHTAYTLQVFAVGFAPGFAYMGELVDELVCPRLATPRKQVPQGAVAIAEKQAAIYPFSSPGGWNLIGLCPWYHNLSDPGDLPEFSVGDRVSFYSVNEKQYGEIVNDK